MSRTDSGHDADYAASALRSCSSGLTRTLKTSRATKRLRQRMISVLDLPSTDAPSCKCWWAHASGAEPGQFGGVQHWPDDLHRDRDCDGGPHRTRRKSATTHRAWRKAASERMRAPFVAAASTNVAATSLPTPNRSWKGAIRKVRTSSSLFRERTAHLGSGAAYPASATHAWRQRSEPRVGHWKLSGNATLREQSRQPASSGKRLRKSNNGLGKESDEPQRNP
jgi:hypothetical protein